MTGQPELEPIEPHIRADEPPDDAILVLRAGPLTAAKFLEHAARQQREYSYLGRPMASVSVAATGAGWTVDRILQERLWSRSTYASANVATIRERGYELLATHARPHFDIVLPSATMESATTLMLLFGAGTTNPFRRRTR